MSKKINILLAFLVLLICIIIYKNWFFGDEIIGGDWPYFYHEMLRDFQIAAPIWSSQEGIGLGGVNPNFPFFSYHHFIIGFFVNILHLPWVLTYKLLWFGLFLALSIFSITFFLKVIYKNPPVWFLCLGVLLYVANTYILMIVGGGQMGIVLAYSIAPLVLARFTKLVDNLSSKPQNLQFPILAGLVFALQVMFDMRLAYLTMGIVLFYTSFYYLFIKRFDLKLFAICYLLFAIVVLGLHAYWLLPLFFFDLFSIPQGLTSIEGFQFFSFADFSHALSLLHPNWSENIFGKTYFLQPEFLLLPILAYASLLLIKNTKYKIQNTKQTQNSKLKIQYSNEIIVFFALLGLLGAFLAKGINPPFGEINQWLFQYIPGMNMFRDPTKFYLMIALSYSVLIPFSVWQIYLLLKFPISNFPRQQRDLAAARQIPIKTKIFNLQNCYVLLVTCYLLLLIRPAWMGQLTGTFKQNTVPKEYVELKDFISSRPEFFRTLWIPTQSRFRFQSENHPLIVGDYLFKSSSPSAILSQLKKDEAKKLLEKLSIRYVIIPYDVTSEIFLEDRKYNQTKREVLEKMLDTVSYLRKVQDGAITIYETPRHYDHFWLEDQMSTISYRKIAASEYEVTVSSSNPTMLTFSEQFHPHWKAMFNSVKIDSLKTDGDINSFAIAPGEHTMRVYFEPQRYAQYSYLFSLTLLVALIFYLLRSRTRAYE